jgi:hypothetical protein
MNMSSCSICLSEEDSLIKCSNQICTDGICTDCMINYIKSCQGEMNLFPKCPNSKCRAEYLYNNIICLDSVNLNNYFELMYNYIKSNPELIKSIDDKNQLDAIIKNIIDEKRIFIEKKFPVCINKTIQICFKKNLTLVNKKNLKLEKDNDVIKRCPNPTCYKGILVEKEIYHQCSICENEFCKSCEKKISNKKHECKQEDLDTIKFLKTQVVCPGCKLVVIKIEGCDSITCSNCRTKFLYSSGEIGGSGSHNVQIKVKDYTSYKLTSEVTGYNNSTMNLLRSIEFKEPVKINDTEFKQILSKILESEIENNTDLKKKLFKVYSKIKNNQHKITRYFQCVTEIEKLHQDKTLTLKNLGEINKLI